MDNRLESEPSPESRAVLYRVALEALTNVRKHAHASSVDVLLERRGVGVAVRVRDDGKGFEVPSARRAPRRRAHRPRLDEGARRGGGRALRAHEHAGRAAPTVDFWMPDENGRG